MQDEPAAERQEQAAQRSGDRGVIFVHMEAASLARQNVGRGQCVGIRTRWKSQAERHAHRSTHQDEQEVGKAVALVDLVHHLAPERARQRKNA